MNTQELASSALNLQGNIDSYFSQNVSTEFQSYAGLTVSALPFFISYYQRLSFDSRRPLLVLCASDKIAAAAAESLKELSAVDGAEQTDIEYFPSWGILPYSYAVADRAREGQRARVLAKLIQKRPITVFTSFDAIHRRTVRANDFNVSPFSARVGFEVNMELLRKFLQHGCYERVDLVEAPGHFSHRGGIWDVFCPGYDFPIRIDLFGDEVESLRFFDPLEQRSLENLKQIELFPAYELNLTGEQRDDLVEKVTTLAGEDYKLPAFTKQPGDKSGLYDFFPLVTGSSSLLEYFPEKTDIFIYDPVALERRQESFSDELRFLADRTAEHLKLPEPDLFLNKDDWDHIMSSAKTLSLLPRTGTEVQLEFHDGPEYKGRFSQLTTELQSFAAQKKAVFCSFSATSQRERFEHILSSYKENDFEPQILTSNLKKGFSWPGGLLLTEYEIFGKNVAQKKISKTTTEIIESFVDLNDGDYIVHVNYGIGRFVRLKRMNVRNIERDFLELEFADSDRLYVPLDQLNLVHRYIGSSENPKLDHLGKKSSWEKTKARVSEAIEKLAEELLELYAKRERSRGYAFSADNRLQEEFEAAFPFEETDHQIAAINEVKKDMESVRPMDRLICGDVGFGKTEVAIRAAFKAAMEGKQVALLCPTTILALQHYNNFKERFSEYPVNIELLSRFRSQAEQKKIKESLSQGKIDIIIGTHALLSEQVQYTELGLLVIDEEQRFGVSHKEKIRTLKANIDTLTMTATPIPRTLHMSLVGIRDLSLIETPPANRKKILTQVLEESEQTLHMAIKAELERGGQIYILHNKVKTIEAQASRIRQMLPAARIAYLHGQMNEDEIESTMLDFYEHRYDVLVATTIIESGIDIPNVNTLVVLNANDFGLSQLYQLKGRVGRSSVQAAAYFFYRGTGVVSEIAQKRLNTLQEYDELGSGFKIAMKDLEIRGAGNLLGKEQSGDILDVGFELYVQMLQAKVEELRGEDPEDDFSCQLIISQDFFFPDEYIAGTRQKMEFYKKMASARDSDALDDIEAELTDRFGTPPDQVKAMISQEKVRILADTLKFDKLDCEDGVQSFSMYASPLTTIDMNRLTNLISQDQRFSLDVDDVRRLRFKASATNLRQALYELKGVLEFILGS